MNRVLYKVTGKLKVVQIFRNISSIYSFLLWYIDPKTSIQVKVSLSQLVMCFQWAEAGDVTDPKKLWLVSFFFYVQFFKFFWSNYLGPNIKNGWSPIKPGQILFCWRYVSLDFLEVEVWGEMMDSCKYEAILNLRSAPRYMSK